MDKDNHNQLSDLEDIVSELQSLSKKQPVKDEDLLRAKVLCCITSSYPKVLLAISL